ncbi:hypothetical protein [Devosia nitrariae]|uniref:Uncharacterized protein n=1 Tax=Devosia nitrariae TaxID=2071872 RepID=A0ABQ5WBN4_9HYPH|nr:hypothetical protein [Devosia nitrariae]GLQ57288.1 hypothetical protein GCM10010862_45470 [Devosia nitrariae]
MSAVAVGSSSALPEAGHPTSPPAPQPVDATQDAVDRALDSAQRLISELRSARFAALARQARDTGA